MRHPLRAWPRPARSVEGLVLCAALLLPAPGVAQIDVPLRVENDWFIVPVTVGDDLTLDFIVDTGAGLSAVTTTTLRRLGGTTSGSVRAQGASGAQELRTARVPSLRVGTLRAWNAQVLVLEDDVLTPDVPGDPDAYDGVLGADVLADHDVLLDPVAGVLRLFSGGEPVAGTLPPLGDPFPLWRIAGPILGHDVEINGSVMPAILDTGARRVVVSPRGARNARAVSIPGTGQSGTPGVGREEVRWEDVDLERVRAGGTELGALEAQVGDLPIFRSLGFGDRAVVLLGNPALRGCPVLISYRTDTIRYCRRPAP
ncbi:MAG TPA: pepsin/retropepsin-like aspartic protease family protein [Longimicrobiales bacterium]|nr:pepsin/retropepsin-like aspartic protease family protein [Longimicrobiales bacterium]